MQHLSSVWSSEFSLQLPGNSFQVVVFSLSFIFISSGIALVPNTPKIFSAAAKHFDTSRTLGTKKQNLAVRDQ
jgi:hypothetical protein